MSALLARLGRVEWHATQLWLLKRGNRGHIHKRGGWEQTRKVSWWKKSYDGGLGSAQFGLGSQQDQKELNKDESEGKSDTARPKGFGLDDLEEDYTRVSKTVEKNPGHSRSGNKELGWSQSSEDAFWEDTSRPAEEFQQAPSKETFHYKPAWGLSEDEPRNESHDKLPGSQKAELGWSQQSEDGFWESTSRPLDAFTDVEQSEVDQEYDTRLDGRPNQANLGYDPRHPNTPDIDVRYEADLPKALEEGDQDLVARCMYAAEDCRDYDFISRLSEDTFTEILHVLEPRRNIQKVANAYIKISESKAYEIGLMPVGELMGEYSWMLQEIAAMRQRCGHRLTQDQYLILLRSAQDLGEPSLSLQLWESMQADGITPDLDMWNAYLAGFIRVGHYESMPRHRERVVNYHMNARHEMRMDKAYKNYHIGEQGIRQKSMTMLKAMLDSNIRANEETYCSIIIAAAREGEIDVVRSVLRKVWDIDVTRLMELNQGDAEVPRPRELSSDSQYYPTTRLLGTLAYAFGINNDVPTALRLVDYVSREYGVAIDIDTWSTLFEWTFVLAQPRPGTQGRQDERTGQLPLTSVSDLFNTMISAPYHVEPTMNMLNFLIKTLRVQDESEAMIREMQVGLALAQDSIRARQVAWGEFNICLDRREMGREHEPVAIARRRWETAAVIHATNHQMMKRWLRLLCTSLESWHRNHRTESRKERLGLAIRTLPRLLWDWRGFTGARVRYDLPTGIVEIQLKSHRGMLHDAFRREAKWKEFEEAMARSPLLVGDSLIHSPLEGRELGSRYTTKRLAKARLAKARRRENWEAQAASG